MSRKPRKQYAPQEKVAILREHLLEGKPISEVCQRHHLQPTVFYAWQKTFFENGAAAFERKSRRAEEAKDRQIVALQQKLADKNEVIAELMEENVRSRKQRSARMLVRYSATLRALQSGPAGGGCYGARGS
jgi:transposase-like protein